MIRCRAVCCDAMTINSKKPDYRKFVSADDIAAALREMAELRDKLDWRRRDIKMMFVQSPELRVRFEAFQKAGGVTADEWLAFMAGKFRHRRGIRRRRHLRLLVNQSKPPIIRSALSYWTEGGGPDAA
jgi:hypothetical protein